MLSLASARLTAGLVQIGAVSVASRHGPAQRARRVRRQPALHDSHPRLGLDCGAPVSRGADAPGGHGRVERRRARRTRDARFHDRHRAATPARAGSEHMNGAQDLGGMMGFGPIAAESDEPWFHASWERRAFALTLAASATGAWN